MDFKLIALVICTTLACAFGQEVINAEDSEDGIQPRCENKEESEICSECARLSPLIKVPSEKCCSDARAFMFCDACIADINACNKLVEELEELAEFDEEADYYDEDYGDADTDDYADKLFPVGVAGLDDDSARAKRFGRLFMKTPKRYGTIFFGKRDSSPDSDIDKRYGHLYMGSGSYFGKRDGSDVEKRYGSLFMNKNRNRWFGKRSGEPDFGVDVDKRYGPLFIGKSRNGWFGKRSDGIDADNDVMKRYGALFMGKGGYFGKRSEPMVADKRFGRLFMGRRRGSWLG